MTKDNAFTTSYSADKAGYGVAQYFHGGNLLHTYRQPFDLTHLQEWADAKSMGNSPEVATELRSILNKSVQPDRFEEIAQAAVACIAREGYEGQQVRISGPAYLCSTLERVLHKEGYIPLYEGQEGEDILIFDPEIPF